MSSQLNSGPLKNHPLPMFLDAGVKVALCTDNPTVSSTTLTREYELAMDLFDLSEDDVRRMARVACESTFLRDGCRSEF